MAPPAKTNGVPDMGITTPAADAGATGRPGKGRREADETVVA